MVERLGNGTKYAARSGGHAGLLGIMLAWILVPGSLASSQSLTFTHLAGNEGGAGSEDGIGTAARFSSPGFAAADSSGNLYVTDVGNNTIRKVTPAGVVTTLAGLAGSPGAADGTGSAAQFDGPLGVAVDASGNVYVADYWNHTIRKVTPAGVVTTLAGLAGSAGSADGTGSAAQFNRPAGVAVDSSGIVYVAESRNHTIRKVTPAGAVTTLAGLAGSPGSADGTGSAARFGYPDGVAVDASGNVYVADSLNHTIRKVTPAGAVTTLAGLAGSSGAADGTGSAARFDDPDGMAVDASGNLYVADYGNHTIRYVTPAGVVTTLAGLAGSAGSADGTGSAARFDNPIGVAVDASGIIYVADYWNHTIRKVTPAGVVTTLAGLAGSSGAADGTGSAAQFSFPEGLAADISGSLYVADRGNRTIRRVTPAGVVTTLAGLAGSLGSADGTGSTARFGGPAGVAVDSSGNVYVADASNHTIRKVTPAGDVTTLAGLALSPGSADGTGSAARFKDPHGVAVDGAGNVYVADRGNHTIRVVTSVGVVTLLAGLAGSPGSADGTGSAARFRLPSGVAVDGAGSVYVTDDNNHTIRKVTPTGVVTTSAGLAGVSGNADGTGSGARFRFPSDVAAGPSGEVLVADYDNHAIRRGTAALADAATIDHPEGPVGQARQLDTAPQTATSWLWRQTRIPAGSTASLSSTAVRNPVFTPDVAGYYVFRLTASDGTATSITEVSLDAVPAASAAVSGGGTICQGQTGDADGQPGRQHRLHRDGRFGRLRSGDPLRLGDGDGEPGPGHAGDLGSGRGRLRGVGAHSLGRVARGVDVRLDDHERDDHRRPGDGGDHVRGGGRGTADAPGGRDGRRVRVGGGDEGDLGDGGVVEAPHAPAVPGARHAGGGGDVRGSGAGAARGAVVADRDGELRGAGDGSGAGLERDGCGSAGGRVRDALAVGRAEAADVDDQLHAGAGAGEQRGRARHVGRAGVAVGVQRVRRGRARGGGRDGVLRVGSRGRTGVREAGAGPGRATTPRA
ncbi:MAG: hypothetical protein EDX89_12655 [Acidobacteria bacterium]|nr:MAG: hypothetical protein EDX89_12655 [Acidobacteriota bacterium]